MVAMLVFLLCAALLLGEILLWKRISAFRKEGRGHIFVSSLMALLTISTICFVVVIFLVLESRLETTQGTVVEVNFFACAILTLIAFPARKSPPVGTIAGLSLCLTVLWLAVGMLH
jgi:hypothetical protein